MADGKMQYVEAVRLIDGAGNEAIITPDGKIKMDLATATISGALTLTGSKAALLKSTLADASLIGLSTVRYFGTNVGTAAITPLDVSNYKSLSYSVKNNYDVAMKIGFVFFNNAATGGSVNIVYTSTPVTLAAGAVQAFDFADFPKLNAPYLGFGVTMQRDSTSAASGSADVYVFGGAS